MRHASHLNQYIWSPTDLNENCITTNQRKTHKSIFRDIGFYKPLDESKAHHSMFTILVCHFLRIWQDFSFEALNTFVLIPLIKCLKMKIYMPLPFSHKSLPHIKLMFDFREICLHHRPDSSGPVRHQHRDYHVRLVQEVQEWLQGKNFHSTTTFYLNKVLSIIIIHLIQGLLDAYRQPWARLSSSLREPVYLIIIISDNNDQLIFLPAGNTYKTLHTSQGNQISHPQPAWLHCQIPHILSKILYS